MGPFDDFNLDLCQGLAQFGLELRSLVAAIGEELQQERIQAE